MADPADLHVSSSTTHRELIIYVIEHLFSFRQSLFVRLERSAGAPRSWIISPPKRRRRTIEQQ